MSRDRNIDVDIIYDYIVEGRSQNDIADDYGLTQSEISRKLREDYGFNKGNTAWGTGKANQSGRYSFLNYEDIEDFVDSGSKNIDRWLDDRNSQDSYDDYDDNDYEEDNNYQSNNSYNNQSNTNYNRPNQQKRKVTYVNTNSGLNLSGKEKLIGLFLLIIAVAIMSVIEKPSEAFEYIMYYVTEGYLLCSFAFAILYGLVGVFIAKIDFRDIIQRPHMFIYLALGFIACGIKYYFDVGYILVSVLACIIGVISLLIGFNKR